MTHVQRHDERRLNIPRGAVPQTLTVTSGERTAGLVALLP